MLPVSECSGILNEWEEGTVFLTTTALILDFHPSLAKKPLQLAALV